MPDAMQELLQLHDDAFEAHGVDGLSEVDRDRVAAQCVVDEHAVIVDQRQRMAGQPELDDLVDGRGGPRSRIQCVGRCRLGEPVEQACFDRRFEVGEQRERVILAPVHRRPAGLRRVAVGRRSRGAIHRSPVSRTGAKYMSRNGVIAVRLGSEAERDLSGGCGQ